jgi:hypothetical protein
MHQGEVFVNLLLVATSLTPLRKMRNVSCSQEMKESSNEYLGTSQAWPMLDAKQLRNLDEDRSAAMAENNACHGLMSSLISSCLENMSWPHAESVVRHSLRCESDSPGYAGVMECEMVTGKADGRPEDKSLVGAIVEVARVGGLR